MASDYQGETIQVFVFFRGKFLGYQCFGQDRLTVGGAPGMDLPLPDCPEEEGFWDVYISRGALYAWLRSPAGGNGKQGHEDPRKVQPLDSLSLGEYRLQARLLEGQGFEQPSTEPEQELTEADQESTEPIEEALLSPDEESAQEDQEEQEASSSEELGEAEEPEPEAAWKAVDEVEGISLDYARSIWKGETEDERAEAAEVEPGEMEAEAPPTEPVEDPAPAETIGAPADRGEPLPSLALDAEGLWENEQGDALSEEPAGVADEEDLRPDDEAQLLAEENLGEESEKADEPDAEVDEISAMEEIEAWIGFGLEQEGPLAEEEGWTEEEPRLSDSEASEDLQEMIPVETGTEEEDEEDEYGQDITYFSLIKEVFPNRTEPLKAIQGDNRALEVVRFRGSDVQDIGYLEKGDDYTIRKGWSRRLWKRQGGVPPDFKLVRLKNGGLAELHLRDSAVKGRLYSEEGSQDIWDLRGAKRGRFGLKGKASWLPLPADTWAVLRVNSARYLVRYVPPRPKPSAQPLRPKVSAGQFKLVSMSLLSHLLLILMVGLAVPDSTLEGYNRTERFARIDPDALKALKPPPPPKELKKPKPVAKKKAPNPKPKPKVASKHSIPKSANKSPVPTKGKASGGGAKKQVDVAQTGLLAALGSPDAGVIGAKGNSEILLAAVTNLDAVAVPSDTTTFNLAGVAGKLATSEIQVPTSDVIETVGAAQLIKNGDGTLGAMASKGSGEVRAVVHEPPKAKISIRGGMSREAVLKVVNNHLDEVRDCYERELLHNPGISGKILMEWLIQLDGTVRYAKVKFTNIGHSSDLHTCLQAQVVTWGFPRPKGGEEVLVTFPFLFESMGF